MSIPRIEALIKELEAIKIDCLGEDKTEKKKKPKDNFIAAKMEITELLNELAQGIQQRNEIMDKYGRNRQAVKLNTENHAKLATIKANWNAMKKAVETEKNKGNKGLFASKLSVDEIKAREETLVLMEQLIKDVETAYHRERPRGMSDNRIASRAKKDIDQTRAEEQKAAQAALKAARAGKGGDVSAGGGAAGSSSGDVEMRPLNHEEEVFMRNVQEQDERIDAKLDQVLQGVRILRQLGEEIHTEITLQATIMKEIDAKVDKTTSKFIFANKKMKQLLDESGGATRWCPILIAVIVLVALTGYILFSAGVS